MPIRLVQGYEGEEVSKVRFESVTPTPGTSIPTDVDVKFNGVISYNVNASLYKEIKIVIVCGNQRSFTLWTYEIKEGKGIITGTAKFSFTVYLAALLGKGNNPESVLLVVGLSKFIHDPYNVHNDHVKYLVVRGYGYKAKVSIDSIGFHYLGKAKSISEVPPALLTIPNLPLATKPVGDVVLKFRIDVAVSAEWSNICPNASATLHLVIRRLVIPTYLTESQIEVKLSPSNKGKDTYTLSFNSYIAPCYEDFIMIDAAIVIKLSTILSQVNVTRSTIPLRAYTKCDTSTIPTSPLVFYEENIDEDGSLNIQYARNLEVMVTTKEGLVKLKLDDMGRLVGNIPWLDKNRKPIPGTYSLRLNKEDETLKEKYGSSYLYPLNRLEIEVDSKGNIKPKSHQSMEVEYKNGIIYVTLRSVVSWDNYIRNKIMSFLRDTGIVNKREIKEIASIKTRYGTGKDEYDPTTSTINYAWSAYQIYGDKVKNGKILPRDLQTIFHEWGHAVKDKLIPDPGIGCLIGGEHLNPASPSSLEVAYDEGHAEFFSCLMIDYCQLASDPYDRYVTGYKGICKRANEIEGRIAGFWLSIYGLESKPSDPSLAIKAYRDFLRTARLFQRVFHEGTQKRPNILSNWKEWFNSFQEWKYSIKGRYKRPPRTINEWIYAKIAIAKDLNEINKILKCIYDRDFILPNLLYDETGLVQGKISGKPYLIMGFVRVIGVTHSYILEGSEDVGVAILNVGNRIVGQGSADKSLFLKRCGGVILRIDPSSLKITLIQDVLGGTILTVKKDSFELIGATHVGTSGLPVSITSGDITVEIRSDVEVIANETLVSIKVFEGNVKVKSSKGEVEVKTGNCVNVTSNGEIGEIRKFEEDKWWIVNFEKVTSSNPVVTQLKTYKVTESGFVEETTFTYEDRYIIATAKIHNCSIGDELVWVFEGPNDLVYRYYCTIKEKDKEYYITLFIGHYKQSEVGGPWKVAIYLNGEKKAEKNFVIKEMEQLSNIVITDYKICKRVENGVPKDITSEFNSKDTVYVWLSIENVSKGDEVKWVFQGPNNISKVLKCKLNWTGEGYAYAWIYLYKYKPKDIEGQWKVIIYLNEKEALTTEFTVKPEESRCLIATATYGSELSSKVQFLRNFRDNIVSSTFAGGCFMKVFNMWYYSFSPTLAKFIAGNSIAKSVMRVILYPLINILYLSCTLYTMLDFNSELAIVLVGLVASSLIGLVYFTMPTLGLLVLIKKKRKLSSNSNFFKILLLTWVMSLAMIGISEFLYLPSLMALSTSILVITTISLVTTYFVTKALRHYDSS